MRLLPLIPILQVAGILATLRMMDRWSYDKEIILNKNKIWKRQILFPLVPNITLTAILVYLQSSGLIRFINLFMPDLAWIARVSGTLAGLWVILRAWFFLRILRKGA
jgi:hypothetical protein